MCNYAQIVFISQISSYFVTWSDSKCFSFQIEETDEARKKFSNAKAISSSQFFGTQNREEKEAQLSLQKFAVGLASQWFLVSVQTGLLAWKIYCLNFAKKKSSLGACSTWIIHFQKFSFFLNFICFDQGSSSISSADLFGRNNVDNSNLDLSAADLINRISFQVAFCKFLAQSVVSWMFSF